MLANIISSDCQKLQLFAEIATFTPTKSVRDPSDPINIKKAGKWFREHLGFLGRRDREDLEAVWKRVVSDPRDSRLLFNAVRVLQEKYQ
jgi:hypothetical protein